MLALSCAAPSTCTTLGFRENFNILPLNPLVAGNNLYSLENAAVQAPITQLQTAAGLLNPGGVVNTQTGQIVTGEGTEYAKTNGGLLNGLLAAASVAAPFVSDRRLKRDIVKIGQEPDGLGLYEYQYVWGGDRHRGVMADEVAKLRPWALGPVVSGYSSVYYSQLGGGNGFA